MTLYGNKTKYNRIENHLLFEVGKKLHLKFLNISLQSAFKVMLKPLLLLTYFYRCDRIKTKTKNIKIVFI